MTAARRAVIVADQGLSSASNGLGFLAIAAAATSVEIGAWSVYYYVLGTALVLLRQSSSLRFFVRRHRRATIGGVLAEHLVVALLGAVILTWVLRDDIDAGPVAFLLAATALLLPLANDAVRILGLSKGSTAIAVLSDAIWFAFAVGAYLVALTTDVGAAVLVGVWLAGALVGAVVMAVWLAVRPIAAAPVPEGASSTAAIRAYGTIPTVSGLVWSLVVVSTQGPATLAVISLAAICLAPVTAVLQAMPALMHTADRLVTRADLRRLWWVFVLPLVWGLLLLLVPDPVMTLLAGSLWTQAREVIGWLGLVMSFFAVQTTAMTGLVLFGRVRACVGVVAAQGIAFPATAVVASVVAPGALPLVLGEAAVQGAGAIAVATRLAARPGAGAGVPDRG